MEDRRMAGRALMRRASGPPRWWVVALAGTACAVLAVLAGFVWETRRLGRTAEDAVARVERAVRDEMTARITSLEHVVATLTADSRVAEALDRRERDVDTLFQLTAAAVLRQRVPDLAVTIYDARGEAVAWSGRPSAELPPEGPSAASGLFVAPSALGWRLVDVARIDRAPVHDTPQGRLATVVAERGFSSADWAYESGALSFPLETKLAQVSMTRSDFAASERPAGRQAVVISTPGGDPLLHAVVSREEAVRIRADGRVRIRAIVLGILGVTALLLAAVWAISRRRARSLARYLLLTAAAIAVILVARVLLWAALVPDGSAGGLLSPTTYASSWLGWIHRTPLDLFVSGGVLAAFLTLLVDPVRRVTAVSRSVRIAPLSSRGAFVRFALWQLLGGSAAALIVWAMMRLVEDTIDNSAIDLLRLSPVPWDPTRLALVFGLILFETTAVWTAVMAFRLTLARWRVDRRRWVMRVLLPALWLLPGLLWAAMVSLRGRDVAALAFILTLVAGTGAAWMTARGIAWYRHGSPTIRLVALFLALLLPALLLYPALFHEVDRDTRRLIETNYATQALEHPEEIQKRLIDSLSQIDEVTALADLITSVAEVPDQQQPSTDQAFTVWRDTDLWRLRLTSSIELHAAPPGGALLSRFAFSLPEYTGAVPPFDRTGCDWEVYFEASRFGAEERRLLHAEKAVCAPATSESPRIMGGISVHASVDYEALEALPFLSPEGPYSGLFRGQSALEASDVRGYEVDLVAYGWGRTPVYTSARRPWPLSGEVFERAYRSREPFWTRVQSGDGVYNVYVANNRLAIFMVGYALVRPLRHLVHLAELVTLAGALYLLVLVAGFVIAWLGRESQPAHALVREVRTSFARKLFLAFVAAAVIPVVILALLVRAFVATRLRADVEEEAARTAGVARRVIEEAVAVQQEGRRGDVVLTDDEMLGISRVIQQDVNIFEGPTLVATSQRDLYASGLLPTRTHDEVYRAIILEGLPHLVAEDQIGAMGYQLAAVPVNLPGQPKAILTVPLASRQREIEQEIDELDRGIHLGAILFILLGAGIGYSMAHRIADPVQRLTRASRRIAAGDLDARVIARTADELRRLVEAFNSMAADLARQRDQLARTERLEAWAQMARQVAHDIKNPLTPIQLAAEHVLRVHRDRGQPLSPVLEGCLETILSQVRMLRQIAAEFASFAASPKARLQPTPIADVIEEVIAPYRAGLTDRVRLHLEIARDLPLLALDRGLLGRAMVNIMENAIHAMPGGGALTVRAARVNDHVHVSFVDTGVGMDEEALSRVFEPYFSNKAAGTGLGLSIARRNVELHGGSITVGSRKGEGATVTLVLPVRQ
ncbi:MAG: HAMP domain-containing protein [Luteitalea sp.]|nr:HAMP domain-containing protein [Luteitalea sp.]